MEHERAAERGLDEVGGMTRMSERRQTRREREAQRRRQVWQNFRAEMGERAKVEARASRAEYRGQAAAIKRGDADQWDGFSTWVHLGLTFLTAGLWLPVLVYVLIRNGRRHRAQAWVDQAREQRHRELQDVKARARSRERELAKQRWRDLGSDLRRLTGRRGA